MTDDSDIIIISYPSGGFGNFLFHVLTEFSDNTYKPNNDKFSFSALGNSHSTKKYTPVYFHDPESYSIQRPNTDKKVLVLCDNGMNDSYTKLRQFLPAATILKVVISEKIRPVIYQTLVIKAMRSDLLTINENFIKNNWVDYYQPYAVREFFKLMYHNWHWGWNPDPTTISINLESLITEPIFTIKEIIKSIDGNVINQDKLILLCNDWMNINKTYFQIYYDWQKIEMALDKNYDLDISHIQDLHHQGYIDYSLEKKYDIVIPVYDYRNWFTSTTHIQNTIKEIMSKL